MAGFLPGDPSHNGMVESSLYNFSHDKLEEADCIGSTWYLSRREIEEISPSRRDGIDLKKEAYFRKSYCTFLQDLGMRLKVPQVTIATAIVFCHRFFLRQSHAKNDRRTIATVCMFLAGKVEETPRPLKDVIIVSYEIIHKKDPAAIQRIKQRDVYEQQKELILLGERVVLATLGFDLNVHHPYKPLVDAIKKFKIAQNALAQVAWNFVNDGLRTSLCLQFKPHHIAAGAIFLAAKFLKVKLPSDGEKVWWQEFDVTPRRLEEVSNQMLELYEQNRAAPPSHGNETGGSPAGLINHAVKAPAASREPTPSQNGFIVAGASGIHHGPQNSLMTRPASDHSYADKQNGTLRIALNPSNDQSVREPSLMDRWTHEPGNVPETSGSRLSHLSDHTLEEHTATNSALNEGPKGYSGMDAMKKIDKDKVKSALEKQRKSNGEVVRKMDVMNEDDLIERELESGIELASEDPRTNQERRPGWLKPHHSQHYRNPESGGGGTDIDIAEEGELPLEFPVPSARKRKAVSPEMDDLPQYHVGPTSKHRESLLERSEWDLRRVAQEDNF